MGAPQWLATGACGDAQDALRGHRARGSYRGRSMMELKRSVPSYHLTIFNFGHRLIQQINCLLEPFILDECSIRLLCCLHKSMAKQMLNVCNRSASTQQASGKGLSQIVRGNIFTGLTKSCQPLGRSIRGSCSLMCIRTSENESL